MTARKDDDPAMAGLGITPEDPSDSGRAELEARKARASRIRNAIGLVLLAAVFAWSLVEVTIRTFGAGGSAPIGSDKRVVRFAHWQLEGRTVQALDEAARQYMELHPDVIVQQIPVPERAYEQWVRTQLIGRTAPDLIQQRGDPWNNLVVRYFVPLSDVVERPNPYNANPRFSNDPSLAEMPWRLTYIDGMRGGFRETLGEYYAMPLSIFTIRIYANADLIRQARGQAPGSEVTPPATIGELFELCREVASYGDRRGTPVTPIAGSKYTADMFTNKYWAMATWGMRQRLDSTYDGNLTAAEQFSAIWRGDLDLVNDPHIRAAHMVLYELGRQFNPGFMSMDRDDSVFQFSQGNAAMIATGSWDAGSLHREVGDLFEIAVFDFPTAAPDDQKYGEFLTDRLSEAGEQAGVALGLTRLSRQPEQAIDFMHFLTSQRINQEINREFRWFPAIVGAEADPILEPFRPRIEGTPGGQALFYGGDTQLQYTQMFQSFLGTDVPGRDEYERHLRQRRLNERELPYDAYVEAWKLEHQRQFVTNYARVFERSSLADYRRGWENGYHGIVQTETGLAGARARAIQGQMSEELDDRVRQNLANLTFGQVRRMMDRADQRMRIQEVEEIVRQREGGR